MNNIYYSPEDHGLKVMWQIEKEPEYDFDMTIVWKRISDGALFWASDSGCSCPSPFEDYSGIGDLTPLTQATFGELESHVRGHWSFGAADKVEFLSKIRRALSRRS